MVRAIKTPTGIIAVDDIAHHVTQEEYDALPEQEQKEGLYYITDDGSDNIIGDLLTIKGVIGEDDIAPIGDGTITSALNALQSNKASASELNTLSLSVNDNHFAILNVEDSVDAVNRTLKTIKAGTRNIALGTNNGVDGWAFTSASGSVTILEYLDDQTKCAKITAKEDPLGSYYISYKNLNLNLLKPNTTYYISFMVYSDIASAGTVSISNSIDSNIIISNQAVEKLSAPNTWTTVTVSAMSYNSFIFNNQMLKITPTTSMIAGDYFIIKDLIITESTIPVDYNLAPEDFLKKISDGSTGSGGNVDLERIDQKITELSGKITSNLNNINSLSENKANKADLVTFQSDLKAVQDGKADKDSITSMNTIISGHTTSINNLQTTKADSTVVSDITNDLTYLTNNTATKSEFNAYKTSNDEKVTANKNDITALNSTKANQADLASALLTITSLSNNKANKSELDDLNTIVTDTQSGYSELKTRVDLIDTTIANKANSSDLITIRSDIKANATDIEGLSASKATVTSVNALKASIATNTENIAKRALITTVEDIAARVTTNTNSISSLISTKAEQSSVDLLSTKIDIINTTLTTVNNRMYYSTYAGDEETDVFISPKFDLSSRGCLFIFGTPDSDYTSAAIITVAYGAVTYTNLGTLEIEVSIEDGKIKVSGTTSNMRYFVIEP